MNFYEDDFWKDYIGSIQDSAYWKLSVGSKMINAFNYQQILELETIADLPISERQDAISSIIAKQRGV